MTRTLAGAAPGRDDASRDFDSPRAPTGAGATPETRRLTMTWTTPQAQDFRFGFEITMYVSAR